MDFYRVNVVIHLLAAIGLVGMALFWFIMVAALKQRFDRHESKRLLSILNRARWPHVVVPYRLRAPLPWISCAMIAVLLLTGVTVALANGMPINAFWWYKISLFIVVLGVQAWLFRRPAAILVRLNFVIILVIVVLSGLMVR